MSGEQLGVMTVPQALQLATEKDVDLVEVAPAASPPVCRLLDYGKFRYEQAKKDRESRKGQKGQEIREVRLRPRTEEHDIEVKARLVRKFLAEGQKVKISVFFRGREITHPELGMALLRKVAESLQEEAKLEKTPSMEGRSMTMILAPAPVKAAPVKAAKPAPAKAAKPAPAQEQPKEQASAKA